MGKKHNRKEQIVASDLGRLNLKDWFMFHEDATDKGMRRKAAGLCSTAYLMWQPKIFIWEEYENGIRIIRMR